LQNFLLIEKKIKTINHSKLESERGQSFSGLRGNMKKSMRLHFRKRKKKGVLILQRGPWGTIKKNTEQGEKKTSRK